MEAINAGSSLSNMAKKYSEDPSSAVKGGDLGFVALDKWLNHLMIPFLREIKVNY